MLLMERASSAHDNLVSEFVRFTYNEASNVIIMGTGSAYHMRGSGFCQRKQLCPRYRPMGLSRNSAFLKKIMDKNSANCQN